MNLEAGYFYSLLKEGDPRFLGSVAKDWFPAEWQAVYDFILSCVVNPEMGRLPRVETVSAKFNIQFQELNEHPAYYIDEMRKLQARLALENKLKEILPFITAESQNNNKPFEACDALMQACAEIRRTFAQTKRGESIDIQNVQTRINEYVHRKKLNGMVGIPYPFEPMNYCTSGMVPGEVTSILARTGVGKTWFMLLAAKKAFENGKNVLFISQEMQPIRVAIRLDSLMSGVPIDRFRRGALTEKEEDTLSMFYNWAGSVGQMFRIVGQKEVKDFSSFEILLSRLRSTTDIIFWDAGYLVVRGEKWEDRAQFVYNIKQTAEEHQIPIMVSWQMNAKMDANSKYADQSVAAYTVAITTDVDQCFALIQSQEDAESQQLKIQSVKTRDGLVLKELMIKWDVAHQDFSIISYRIPGYGDSSKDYRTIPRGL